MKYDRKFSIRRNSEWDNIEKFYERVAKFMTTQYGCKKDDAILSVQNALRHNYAVCTGKKNNVLVESSLHRDTIYVGCIV